jgi:predicted HicB family RNase H-like nuclease
MARNVRDPIPEFETLEDIADFWDTHSTADYEDLTYEVQFEVQLEGRRTSPKRIILLPELSAKLEASARAQGVSVETLVNAWLTQKVLEHT